ncbi:DUF2264 domain-containing protein [Streptomyces sp. DSM 44915]|uniref:DUF2264 domain-containing protein n=1 Tax=Streptomyces chisholmiae TaxID=3075540 RepID=A0ABU2JTZ5_9ACTN|nr:DUF2264 domain-containing protein [Streptomyces sp. DSM 44915]MDT0268236.1 DUF2264 domain-containing protein [Streptomyces sp. DSM 44915]
MTDEQDLATDERGAATGAWDLAGGAPDFTRSPYTGWTRAHWLAAADRLLAAVRPHAAPGHALIQLPGPASGSGRHSDGLEGYARTFLLAAFRTGGANLEDPCAPELLAPYAEGLATGTDPGHPHAWPRPADLPQARVEAASVALGLHETRPLLWDRLPAEVQERTVAWLSELAGVWVPHNNWLWFRATVAAFLRSVGAPFQADDIARAVEATEDWYAGAGWYTDGAYQRGQFRNFDYYNAWAMHLYPLWYTRIAGRDAEPGLADRYRARLRTFVADAEHLVAADGGPLFQGRSLTYRFAAAAPFWAGALFDATPLPPGRTRRIASGMLRHFLDRGAAAEDGLLSLGWHHRFEPMRQRYSGPASPYWASKGMAGLLLPADHPVWTATEERLAVERGDFVRPLPGPGWLAAGTAADGVVRIANHGTDHTPPDLPGRDDPHYARVAYSTHAGPELGEARPPAADREGHQRDGDARLGAPVDNQVTLLAPDGTPGHRSPLRRLALTADFAASRHRPHWPADGSDERADWPAGPWVTTVSTLRGPWEVRFARVGQPQGDARVLVGGHALAAARPPVVGETPGVASARRADGLTSAVLPLFPAEAELTVHRATGGNAFGPHSATPAYRAGGPLHVVAVFLGHTGPAAGLPPAPTVSFPDAGPDAGPDSAGWATAVVRWPDGTETSVPLGE